MNRRAIWGSVAALLFVLGYFLSNSPSGKFTVLALAAVFAIAAFQTIWNFDGFKSAFSIFDKDTSTLGRRLMGFGSLILPFVIAMGIFSGRESAAELAEMKQKGVITEAVITDGWSTKRRRSGTSYTLKLKFKDQAGADQEVEEGVDSHEFEMVSIGMPVQIIYVPGNLDLLDVLLSEGAKAKYGK